MNLDGETNLKEKTALFDSYDESKLPLLNGEVRCDLPNENLDKWDAQLFFRNGAFKPPIANIKNLLLRGCYVRNTNFGIGVVTYTGMDSKIMKNFKKPPHKVSDIMRMMNKMLYTVFLFQICIIILFAGLNVNWVNQNALKYEYLRIDLEMNGAARYFIQLLVYWVAYSHMIPISLYVIIEILKLGSAIFINKDLQMYDPDSNQKARCRNSDLIEELGQVEMVFSDKTGTLTQNKMIFKKCQINGIRYGDQHKDEKNSDDGMVPSGIKATRKQIREEAARIASGEQNHIYCTEFFELLTLCNTVVCEKNQHGIEYKASSPDELALVKGAKNSGIQLVSKEHNRIQIFNMLSKQLHTYKFVAEFPFDSNRKRMSVVLKNMENGETFLLCKGADSVMLDRIDFMKNEIEDLRDIVEEDLYLYSSEGLRTLIVAKRTINKEEYKKFKRIFNKLQRSNHKRKEEKLNLLYETMEQKLRYLGSTAIEDKLQDGVAITISKLMEADIRFFMLTGDKLETAIEIAKSCNVIQDDMEVVVIGKAEKQSLYRRLNNIIKTLDINVHEKIKCLNQLELENMVITIDGASLGIVLAEQDLQEMFFHIAIRSRSVVCCRMSPKQKADVVHLFKSRGKWITLAIGDGANDVSMIMEAHIGIGIRGKEGTQAVRSADFAISQFKFLMRLLLFHGRLGYLRVSQMICYYFYKNIILVFAEMYFAFYNGWSGQIYFLDWLPMLYNAIFTSWHCLFAQLLEQDVNQHYSFRYPQVYKAGQIGYYFNYKVFWKWIVLSIWHGLASFYGPLLVADCAIYAPEYKGSSWYHSTISFTVIIHVVFYKLLLETRHFNLPSFVAGLISLMLYYLILVLGQSPYFSFLFQTELLGLLSMMFRDPNFWAQVICLPFFVLIPDFTIKLYKKVLWPNPIDKVLHTQKFKDPKFNFDEFQAKQDKIVLAKKRKNQIKNEERMQLIEEKKASFSKNTSDDLKNKQSSISLGKISEHVDEEDDPSRHFNSKQSKPRFSAGKKYSDDSVRKSKKRSSLEDSDIREDSSQVSSSDEGSRGSLSSSSNSDSDSRDGNSQDSRDVSNSSLDESILSSRRELIKEKPLKKEGKIPKVDLNKIKQGQKGKVDSNSMFSVSDQNNSSQQKDGQDEMEFDDKQPKPDNSKYIAYFENLNRGLTKDNQKHEIQKEDDKANFIVAKTKNTTEKKRSLRQSNSIQSQIAPPTMIQIEERKIKSSQNDQRDKTIEVEYVDQSERVSQQINNNFMDETPIKIYNAPINKEVFKKICENRNQYNFYDVLGDEIPENKIQEPQHIIDRILPNINKQQTQKINPDQLKQNGGHPLEQNLYYGFDIDMSTRAKNRKKKKYVEKYRKGTK